MLTRDLTVRLSEELLDAAVQLARSRDVTLGHLVRDLLAKEIGRQTRARPPVRADEQLVAPLRARLAGDFADSSGWGDLQRRLQDKGFVLRQAGGGLALHAWPDDRRLCKAS